MLPKIVEGATYSHYAVAVPDREKEVRNFSKEGIHLGRVIDYNIPSLNSYSQLKQVCRLSNVAASKIINLPLI